VAFAHRRWRQGVSLVIHSSPPAPIPAHGAPDGSPPHPQAAGRPRTRQRAPSWLVPITCRIRRPKTSRYAGTSRNPPPLASKPVNTPIPADVTTSSGRFWRRRVPASRVSCSIGRKIRTPTTTSTAPDPMSSPGPPASGIARPRRSFPERRRAPTSRPRGTGLPPTGCTAPHPPPQPEWWRATARQPQPVPEPEQRQHRRGHRRSPDTEQAHAQPHGCASQNDERPRCHGVIMTPAPAAQIPPAQPSASAGLCYWVRRGRAGRGPAPAGEGGRRSRWRAASSAG
jgi:hypothetical protein